MRYFPLFLDLTNKPVLVVGGGEVACRKIDALLRAGAKVTIVSPQIASTLQSYVDDRKCQWIQNFYSSQLLTKEYLQVWATTDNPELNHQVHKDAKKLGILVNVVDDQPYCDFITPSMIERGRIQLAISSGGASPVLIRNVRETLEAVLPQNLGLLADFGASKRNSIKEFLPTVDLRRKFWELFFAETEVKNAKDRESLEKIYIKALDKPLDERGEVTWVEFGQDVELLPLKALRYMQQAELVLHARSCPFEFIDLCRRDAEREHFSSAAELSERLQQASQAQLRVCVLIPQGTQEYALLQAQQRVLGQGYEK
ncbi:siroheme synthase [Vibrio sp. Vb2880]|uniref:NAD(P)-dependent oxidoreductase n=1 Tax=Vibrio TaxID=662 RepID=UPI0001B92EC2|nr:MULTISPECIES: NAD(P)-dependent oxidoreductase [Vibrio]EEX41750.1 siroheme synthase/precorrin-2 oxidase/sirohydrochlorin ferrochelatase [Vibrio furnissii CIP 102972]MBO0215227.1 siroheme synthase [Vibrio sp. Vb2880]MCG6233796.1 siroheme synthase [Vibrio furnissii]MCG6259888.1 siroheme synthase [Vibrio furnissii]QDC93007.1 siroheme synthase [Vibrio furnissii]